MCLCHSFCPIPSVSYLPMLPLLSCLLLWHFFISSACFFLCLPSLPLIFLHWVGSACPHPSLPLNLPHYIHIHTSSLYSTLFPLCLYPFHLPFNISMHMLVIYDSFIVYILLPFFFFFYLLHFSFLSILVWLPVCGFLHSMGLFFSYHAFYSHPMPSFCSSLPYLVRFVLLPTWWMYVVPVCLYACAFPTYHLYPFNACLIIFPCLLPVPFLYICWIMGQDGQEDISSLPSLCPHLPPFARGLPS